MSTPLDCPHCGKPVLRVTLDGQRLKARTPIVVLHKSGAVEINCESCKKGVLLPARVTGEPLRKAEGPRLGVMPSKRLDIRRGDGS